jgi:hypothetical protein
VFTLNEIIEKRKALQTKLRLDSILLFGYLLAGIAVVDWFQQVFEANSWLFLVLVVGIIPLLMLSQKLRHQQLGLECPHCKVRLEDSSIRLAIASKNCGSCGNRIVKD